MSRKLLAASLVFAGVVCCFSELNFSTRVSAQVKQMLNAQCTTGICTSFNWANVVPYDNNGNPLPAGSCNLWLGGPNVSICAQSTATCSWSSYSGSCTGLYTNPQTGNTIPCAYWCYNC